MYVWISVLLFCLDFSVIIWNIFIYAGCSWLQSLVNYNFSNRSFVFTSSFVNIRHFIFQTWNRVCNRKAKEEKDKKHYVKLSWPLLNINISFARFVTLQVNYLFGFLILLCSSFFDFWRQLKFLSILGEEKFSKVWPFVAWNGRWLNVQ